MLADSLQPSGNTVFNNVSLRTRRKLCKLIRSQVVELVRSLFVAKFLIRLSHVQVEGRVELANSTILNRIRMVEGA